MRVLRTVSWVLLAIAGALVLLGSIGSAYVAYKAEPEDDVIVRGTTGKDVAEWRPDAATALRARRGTAAAFAAGYAVLVLVIVLLPYRRGEVWAWWALLAGSVTVALVTWLRVPALGTRQGAGAGALQLGIVALALLLDAGRLRSVPPAVPTPSEALP